MSINPWDSASDQVLWCGALIEVEGHSSVGVLVVPFKDHSRGSSSVLTTQEISPH